MRTVWSWSSRSASTRSTRRRSAAVSASRRSSDSSAKEGRPSSCSVWSIRGNAEDPGTPVDGPRYGFQDLLDFGAGVLERLDVPPPDAHEVSACLIKAELRGVDSHGMVRLPVYAGRLTAGVVKAVPTIRAFGAGTASALVDGDNGLGPVVGARAMDTALDLARDHGTGFV